MFRQIYLFTTVYQLHSVLITHLTIDFSLHHNSQYFNHKYFELGLLIYLYQEVYFYE